MDIKSLKKMNLFLLAITFLVFLKPVCAMQDTKVEPLLAPPCITSHGQLQDPHDKCLNKCCSTWKIAKRILHYLICYVGLKKNPITAVTYWALTEALSIAAIDGCCTCVTLLEDFMLKKFCHKRWSIDGSKLIRIKSYNNSFGDNAV